MDVTWTVEQDRLNHTLRILAQETGQSFSKVVRRNARLIAVNLAHDTQPYGFEDSAKQEGIAAVRRDVSRVYATPQSVYTEFENCGGRDGRTGKQLANAFMRAIRAGDFKRVRSLLDAIGVNFQQIGKFDAGESHRKRRNKQGRISAKRQIFLATNGKEVKRYADELVKRVGSAKGGWATCARAIGGVRDIPKWVHRHRKFGSVDDRTNNQTDPSVTMHNTCPYLRNLLTEAQVRRALRIQRGKMREHLEHVLEAQARKLEIAA